MSPTVDAETQEFALLQAYIPSSQKDASSNFEAILDFINVTDEKIDQLFVTNRIRHRDHDNVRYPPAGERRTASQIRQWFKYSSVGAKAEDHSLGGRMAPSVGDLGHRREYLLPAQEDRGVLDWIIIITQQSTVQGEKPLKQERERKRSTREDTTGL